MYKVGLLGAGSVGARRAQVVVNSAHSELSVVYDPVPDSAERVATTTGAAVAGSWEDVVDDPALDIIVVSTTHDSLASSSVAALNAGKHVLCEKPVGRTPDEVQSVVAAAETSKRCLKAGYNHRYHPAIAKVVQVVREGGLGPLTFLRARYGHGGRPGYDREWRADPERSGGGELLDQGAHLVDLFHWIMGDFDAVSGSVATMVWDMAPQEDNAFALFQTAAGQTATLHVSWTQWKNLFSLEVFGRDGYATVEGLGGSYGKEIAIVAKRAVTGGPPEETPFEFPEEDPSWSLEWEDLLRTIEGDGDPLAGGHQALHTIEWIHRLYRAARERRWVYASEAPTS
jgi:predicted dehydrogenase